MKKLFFRVLICILVVFCFLTIGACFSPELSIDEARTNLKNKGYTVKITAGSDVIEFEGYYLIEELYAENKSENNFIRIYHFKESSVAKAYYNNIVERYGMRISYAESAVKYYKCILEQHKSEMTSEEIEDVEREIEYRQEDIETYNNELKKIGRSGTCVWYGTYYAIQDSKSNLI